MDERAHTGRHIRHLRAAGQHDASPKMSDVKHYERTPTAASALLVTSAVFGTGGADDALLMLIAKVYPF